MSENDTVGRRWHRFRDWLADAWDPFTAEQVEDYWSRQPPAWRSCLEGERDRDQS